MNDETEKPSYERTNKERILAMAGLIPARTHERPEKIYREFRLVDAERGRMLFIEWYHDDYTLNQAPEGILCFSRGITTGVITPEGEVLSGSSGASWRATLVESHGDIKVTSLAVNNGRPDQTLLPRQWADLINAIQDESIRQGMVVKCITQLVPHNPTYVDFLSYAHTVHMESVRHRTSFKEVSAITLF